MSKSSQIIKRVGQEHRQKLAELIKKAAYKHSTWQIWDDLMYFGASALSQSMQWVQSREDEYMRRIERYDKSTQSLFSQMFYEIVLAFEQEGYTDILGDMYMQLELYNKWKGQFFTPSTVCDCMTRMVDTDLAAMIERQGFITVNDPCCGGGAMLIAFAKNALEKGINYQNSVLFVGQDIDPVVVRMCYISMSLLGMPGYVIIGNSLLHPPTVDGVKNDDCDYWFTPLYYIQGFQWRRQKREVKDKSEVVSIPKVPEAAKASPKSERKEDAANDIAFQEEKYVQMTLF